MSQNTTTTIPTRKKRTLLDIVKKNIVPIVFFVFCLGAFFASGMQFPFFLKELITRLGRNSFLVISLIIPVLAGLGLNFGIVLGAMAGQFAAIITVIFQWGKPSSSVLLSGLGGIGGFVVAMILAIPFAVLFGWMTGEIYNRAKGKEMITGMILGYFANGIYQLIAIYMMGSVIPIPADPDTLLAITIKDGVGLVNTLDLGIWAGSLDNLTRNGYKELAAAFPAFKTFMEGLPDWRKWIVDTIGSNKGGWRFVINAIPWATFILTLFLCIAVNKLFKTKLGQNFRAVGQNRHVAEVAGIKVNKTRIIAVVFSTVLAAWGQLIFLQNMGNLSTYNSHVQVGTFAVAALLVGGATVSKATIGQAIIGILLFHSLFILSPLAGKNLMGDTQVGEFFRVFVSYGVIALALVLHAWQRKKK